MAMVKASNEDKHLIHRYTNIPHIHNCHVIQCYLKINPPFSSRVDCCVDTYFMMCSLPAEALLYSQAANLIFQYVTDYVKVKKMSEVDILFDGVKTV